MHSHIQLWKMGNCSFANERKSIFALLSYFENLSERKSIDSYLECSQFWNVYSKYYIFVCKWKCIAINWMRKYETKQREYKMSVREEIRD